MINYWIFTVKDDKIGTMKKKGIEIYKQRMHDGFWGYHLFIQAPKLTEVNAITLAIDIHSKARLIF